MDAAQQAEAASRPGGFPIARDDDASTAISSRLSDGVGEDGSSNPSLAAARTRRNRRSYRAPISHRWSSIHQAGAAGEANGDEELQALPNFGTSNSSQSRHQPTLSTMSSTPSTMSSRSFIPSLTSRAFYQPMSSQKLQAHRNQRPTSMQYTRRHIPEDFDDARTTSNTNRNSTGSALANDYPAVTSFDLSSQPPPTRDTNNTGWTGLENKSSFVGLMNPEIGGTAAKPYSPTEPLPQANTTQDPEKGQDLRPGELPQRNRSPRSLIESFRRNSKRYSGQVNAAGHEKLWSRETSPTAAADKQSLQRHLSRTDGYNYQHWTGNTVFLFRGRWQNARDKPVVLITGTIVVVPTILFFIFTAPWLWHHVSPALPIIYAYLFYVCMSSYFHASVTDPGILPRNLHPIPLEDPNRDPLALGPALSEWTMVYSPVPAAKAYEVPTKYCKSCNIWRPPRCHHCRVCDNCIETQDHHCVWLNNCVGRRNYRYFFVFVASGTLLGLLLMSASIGQVMSWRNQFNTSTNTAISHNRVSFAMFLYGILAFAYPSSLLGYHTFLVARGTTTREYLQANKFLKKDRHRPFRQKSWWQNFVVVLLRARSPKYLDFHHKYSVGDQRFAKGAESQTATPPNPPQQPSGGVEMQQFQVPRSQGPRSQASKRSFVDRTPRDEFYR